MNLSIFFIFGLETFDYSCSSTFSNLRSMLPLHLVQMSLCTKVIQRDLRQETQTINENFVCVCAQCRWKGKTCQRQTVSDSLGYSQHVSKFLPNRNRCSQNIIFIKKRLYVEKNARMMTITFSILVLLLRLGSTQLGV